MSQTIESYLVSLGFDVKQSQLQTFNNSIEKAGKAVSSNTSGIVSDLFKMQFALTSAFVAVGAGVVAMVDKVAMADQSYRLMGLQMFMTKNAARSMDVALKALGATIDQVAWDPELHERYVQLQADQKAMAASLGPDFEKNMRGIRDIRFEFSRLQVEMQYLSMSVVNDLFTKLGFGGGSFLEKLQGFNNWIISHLPEITNAINNVLVPAMKGLWEILKDVGEIGKEAWITFQQIIGILHGDSSLDGASVSLQTVSSTLQHLTEDAHMFLQAMLSAEKVVAHFALALADIGTGHFGAAADQLKEAFQSFTPGGGAILGTVGGSALGGTIGGTVGAALGVEGGPLLMAATGAAGATAGSWIGGGAGALAGWFGGKINPMAGGSASGAPGAAGSVTDHLSALAAAISSKTGIPAALLFGQLMHESGQGTNRGATTLHNYSGVKGPDGQYRDFHTDAEYISFMSRMFTDRRYSATGLLAAKNAEEYANDLKKAGYYGDSVSNYTRGIERFEGGYVAPSITVGDINVTVAKTNASPDDIGRAVKSHVQSIARQQNVIGQANATGVHQ